MQKILFFVLIILSFNAFSESKLSVDISIDKLQFQKPPKGVGKAGLLVFKTANVNNNGIVLNINNVNNLFDSQIFVRPTFLGFTTQFGNYGFALEENSALNAVATAELQNSKLVMDDSQLNLAGETFHLVNPDADIKLANFRLYCQSSANAVDNEVPAGGEVMQNCFNFLTLNGSYIPNNDFALMEYSGVDKTTGDKTFVQAKVKSFDLRKTQINVQLGSVKTVSNDSYIISAGDVNLNCDKDEDLTTLDFDKIKKACLNRFKLAPVKASLEDQKAKSKFSLDIKDVTIKDKVLYFTMNSGALSDLTSTTYLTNLLLNCRKETDTDVFDLMQVLRDCISYSRITIAEVKSTKPDDKKDSSIKNIGVTANNGAAVINAEAKFLGITAKVIIYGNVTLNESKRQLSITVTDTKLPLGLNSVKLLMYFLKKNLISKDITIVNNVITIAL